MDGEREGEREGKEMNEWIGRKPCIANGWRVSEGQTGSVQSHFIKIDNQYQ